MASKDKERYDVDEQDGLRRDVVGSWAAEKHLRLRRYVDITRSTRAKFAGNAPAYVDLYCATGRSRIRDTAEVVEGSPLVAASEAAKHTPFGRIHIGDLDRANVEACSSRLRATGFTAVTEHVGPAVDTAREVVAQLNPYGLHLAFLDPYNLVSLPFELIRTLSMVKRMDLIIHVSEMDLQRNVIGKGETEKLELFAPGWQKAADVNLTTALFKHQLLTHWRSLLAQLGYHVSDNIERVTGAKNQPLYWLVLASRDKLADRFWGQVSKVGPQQTMNF